MGTNEEFIELMTLVEVIKSAYKQDKNGYLVIVFFERNVSEIKIKSEKLLLNSLEEGEINVCIRLLDLLPDEELVYNTDYIIERIEALINHKLDQHAKVIINANEFMRD